MSPNLLLANYDGDSTFSRYRPLVAIGTAVLPALLAGIAVVAATTTTSALSADVDAVDAQGVFIEGGGRSWEDDVAENLQRMGKLRRRDFEEQTDNDAETRGRLTNIHGINGDIRTEKGRVGNTESTVGARRNLDVEELDDLLLGELDAELIQRRANLRILRIGGRNRGISGIVIARNELDQVTLLVTHLGDKQTYDVDSVGAEAVRHNAVEETCQATVGCRKGELSSSGEEEGSHGVVFGKGREKTENFARPTRD